MSISVKHARAYPKHDVDQDKAEEIHPRDVKIIAQFWLVTIVSSDNDMLDLTHGYDWATLDSKEQHRFLSWLSSAEGQEVISGYFRNHGEHDLTFDITKITFDVNHTLPILTVEGWYRQTKERTSVLTTVIGEIVDHYYRAGDFNVLIRSLTFPDPLADVVYTN